MKRLITGLFGQSGKLRDFVKKLGPGGLGSHGEATCAGKRDSHKAWEDHINSLEQVTLACGAKWARDGEGDWYLIDANGAKKETAVRELLEHFGAREWLGVEGSEEERSRVSQLTALCEFGMGLPVDYFERAGKAKNAKRQPCSTIETEKER